ncbi:alpha/beta hydrolase [Terasakiella brassicae]|uniref:Alpha/beta hydrolase n=1 Tax=Terasakiella brassicae TaxID=1634917 RepID=A0A917BQY5_9PROT|nr:alpha/beta fold hydrolase [Terasakiella brassicae]GGF51207.1 alpha/beta hydrolase [Terasakiella brassicae]
MKKLVFVHGWGFAAEFWHGLATELPEFASEFVNLGFLGDVHPINDPNAVYITHSMGLAWVVEQVANCQAIVAINGFTKFCRDENWSNGVPPRMLERMIRQFDRTPETVWTEFMKNCGAIDPVYPTKANTEALSKGLRCLRDCDIRLKFKNLTADKLIIAGDQDRIVPEKLTRASFGEDVIWYKGGNHLLPLFEQKKLAVDIRRFLDR